MNIEEKVRTQTDYLVDVYGAAIQNTEQDVIANETCCILKLTG